jgi:hypothetical protein
MTFARMRFAAALAVFVGWLGWLGYAVYVNTFHKPVLVSRAQLTDAVVLVVADVPADEEGKPRPLVTVATLLSKGGPAAGAEIVVENLPAAQPPGKPFPGPGPYLLPLVPSGEKAFRVAALPRSPGYPAANTVRPLIYPWDEAVQKQLRVLGYSW